MVSPLSCTMLIVCESIELYCVSVVGVHYAYHWLKFDLGEECVFLGQFVCGLEGVVMFQLR